MKTIKTAAAVLSLALLALTALAEEDGRKPGLYTVVNGESIPISFTYGTGGGSLNSSASAGGLKMTTTMAKTTVKYEGVTSGIVASDTLVLVVDMKKGVGVISPKKFDYFGKKLTPENMMVIPLVTNNTKQRREFEQGTIIDMIKHIKDGYGEQFSWKQISDNSYEIILSDLIPGEYGVLFRLPLSSEYLTTHLFGFTIK